jgi:hypothetical protein
LKQISMTIWMYQQYFHRNYRHHLRELS